jgi:type II secretory pathway pseudopilin PulG
MGRRLETGMTLLEVTLLLTVTTALMAALAPTLTATIRHAEVAAATTAMTDISAQVLEILSDMGYNDFTVDGIENSTEAEMLVSDGDIPRELAATGDARWQRPVDLGTGFVDFLENHLVQNQPRGNPANAYNPPGGGTEWRGAYLTSPIDPDPWGNRYAVNVEFLTGGSDDVVVLSAGPDEQIDSDYEDNGLTAVDDDIVVLVEP